MPAQKPLPSGGEPLHVPADIKTRATDQFEKIADKAMDTLGDVAGRAQDLAGRVADQGREVGDRVQEVAGNMKGAVDNSIKDQPMATLAVAGAIGFVLGALWKS